MPVAKSIQTQKYLAKNDIQKHLEGVEFIIMAAPAPEKFKDTPIHFTFFLNTQDKLPVEIKDEILNKFLQDNEIINPIEVMNQIMPVGFSQGEQETLMPLLIIKPEDMRNIPNYPMLVIDFLADSNNFEEAKKDSLVGWTYSYN